MVSTAGLEPATPGFIPLRLPPPSAARDGDVRGLDCPFTMGFPEEACRRRPSSLYTFPT